MSQMCSQNTFTIQQKEQTACLWLFLCCTSATKCLKSTNLRLRSAYGASLHGFPKLLYGFLLNTDFKSSKKAFTAVEPFTHAFNAYHFMNHIPEGFIHHTVKEAAAALFLYILAPREVPRL